MVGMTACTNFKNINKYLKVRNSLNIHIQIYTSFSNKWTGIRQLQLLELLERTVRYRGEFDTDFNALGWELYADNRVKRKVCVE